MNGMDSFGTIIILVLALAVSMLLRKGGGRTSC